MKKMFVGALALSMTALFAGCTDTSTPEGVIAKAAKAVQNGKLRALKSTLAGDARKEFGNAAGMTRLQIALGSSKLSLETPVKTGEKYLGGSENVVVKTYATTALEGKMALEIKCEDHDTQMGQDNNSIPYDTFNTITVTFCYITQLKLN